MSQVTIFPTTGTTEDGSPGFLAELLRANAPAASAKVVAVELRKMQLGIIGLTGFAFFLYAVLVYMLWPLPPTVLVAVVIVWVLLPVVNMRIGMMLFIVNSTCELLCARANGLAQRVAKSERVSFGATMKNMIALNKDVRAV